MTFRRRTAVVALLAGVSVGGYLLASHWTYRIGFPLDDAWIHQTYARNLAVWGEWAFVPGEPSAGSTAPLWSALLALGHALGLGPYVWAYLLGWGLLVGLGLVGAGAVGVFAPERKKWGMAGAALLALEWHLVWAAGSGMETLLFALLATLALAWAAAGCHEGQEGVRGILRRGRWFWLGIWIGISVWVRPDGVTLLAPAGAAVLFPDGGRGRAGGARVRALAAVGLGFVLVFLPYLGFNQMLAGAWWPNTFFAKQAEYAALREGFFLSRLGEQLGLLTVGVGAVLLPGVGVFGARALSGRRWGALAGMGWVVGYAGLYAWRLPVTYQHGRYLMPAIPIFLLWGLAGMLLWAGEGRGLARRVLARAWGLAAGVVLAAFWGLGARAYAWDVAVIESEMVAMARWVAGHTEAGARIAAHDVGALGYFGGREVLDMAGLVSPEVIPFIRDEGRLAAYLDAEGADYLATLEGWYPALEAGRPVVFVSGGEFAPAQGGTNMVVYLWGEGHEGEGKRPGVCRFSLLR